MKRLFICCFMVLFSYVCGLHAAELSCGVGYVLVETRQKLDGIKVSECQKLWCVDLETGKKMGNDNVANSGYTVTSGTNKLCDNDNNCVECWGDRKWCAGEVRGQWNSKYGAYTRNGEDNATYESYQKGSCFAWRLEKPQCDDGMTAILQDNNWVCVTADGDSGISRESAVRRTGTMRRIRF